MTVGKDLAELIRRSEQSLAAARVLLANKFFGFAASRSYYAMFYATEALLLTRSMAFSKHKAVISAFGREFAKMDLVPVTLHRYLIDAYDLRQAGDYGSGVDITFAEGTAAIERATEFLRHTKKFLRKHGYEV